MTDQSKDITLIVTSAPTARHALAAGRHTNDRPGARPVALYVPNPPAGQPGRHRASLVVRAFRITTRTIGRAA